MRYYRSIRIDNTSENTKPRADARKQVHYHTGQTGIRTGPIRRPAQSPIMFSAGSPMGGPITRSCAHEKGPIIRVVVEGLIIVLFDLPIII